MDEHDLDETDHGLDVVVMELESTVNFEGLDVDIDNIIEHSTLEEFLHKIQDTKKSDAQSDSASPIPSLDGKVDGEQKPTLIFDDEHDIKNKLESKVRIKKQLRKQSAIFDTEAADSAKGGKGKYDKQS